VNPAVDIGVLKHIDDVRRLPISSGSPGGPLERAERLEQLRALENGHRIRVVETEYESLGVDTPKLVESVGIIRKMMVNG